MKTDELQIKLEEKKSESTASVTLLPTKRETEKKRTKKRGDSSLHRMLRKCFVFVFFSSF